MDKKRVLFITVNVMLAALLVFNLIMLCFIATAKEP